LPLHAEYTDIHTKVPISGRFPLFQGILVPKLTLGPFITLSVRNEPSSSFGTNVPCILKRIKIQPYRA